MFTVSQAKAVKIPEAFANFRLMIDRLKAHQVIRDAKQVFMIVKHRFKFSGFIRRALTCLVIKVDYCWRIKRNLSPIKNLSRKSIRKPSKITAKLSQEDRLHRSSSC